MRGDELEYHSMKDVPTVEPQPQLMRGNPVIGVARPAKVRVASDPIKSSRATGQVPRSTLAGFDRYA